MDKDLSIIALLERLRLEERGWEIVDDWDADMCAVGIAKVGSPRRLVYVSTFKCPLERYYYDCEEPGASERPDDYHVTETGEGVDFATLLRVMERHLG